VLLFVLAACARGSAVPAQQSGTPPAPATDGDAGAWDAPDAGNGPAPDAGNGPAPDGGAPRNDGIPSIQGTWRWENPLPSGEHLRGVWAATADDVWAAGTHGALMHWDGHAWTAVASPTQARLNALWGSGAADVWAAGEEGTLLHYDGRSWSAVESGTTAPLGVLSGTAPDDVWVSSAALPIESWGPPGGPANGAVLLHFDGRGWSRAPVDAPTAVAAVAPNDVWAGTCGGASHFDGTSWRSYPTPSGCIRAIAGVRGGPVLLSNETPYDCGAHSTVWCAGYTLLGFDGGGFHAAAGPATPALAAGEGRIWAFQPGYTEALLRFDGSAWQTLGTSERDGTTYEQAFIALAVVPGGEAWIVSTYGRRKHFDGTSLKPAFPAPLLWAMGGSSECNVWATGENAAVLHRDCDGSWTPVDLVAAGVVAPSDARAYEDGQLYQVASSTPDDVWIEDGHAKLLHFDGAAWSSEMAPKWGVLASTQKGELYVGSRDGLWLRTTVGWEAIPALSKQSITQITAIAPDDVWVISGDGICAGGDGISCPAPYQHMLLHHFDGAAWSLALDFYDSMSRMVFGTGPNDMWLTGYGKLEHFDGSKWTSVPPLQDPFSAAPGPPGGLWIEGAGGNTSLGDFFFDGKSWTNFPSPGADRGLFHVGHTLFAFGWAGEILSRPDRP